MAPPITLRSPSSLPSTATTSHPSSTVVPPQLSWLEGSWNVTHSTLPMWRKSRNVVITYKAISNTHPTQLNDTVTHQPLNSSTIKTISGVDKPFDPSNTSSEKLNDQASLGYTWRGKGWLMIATSKWEILGFGEEDGGNKWAVTYFAKTLFTPAGVDFYSGVGRLREETVEGIKDALRKMGGEVEELVGQVFEVRMSGNKKDAGAEE
ncbi:hypothetical protein BCR34DRAFT_562883 [Clohesyomyces aquaticus]|uniref:Uncharacterized protein n=1 Tax=Clohesyomyces aquaticus TaxID=1231657 RepID=A0A1Y1ZRR6_9PLEO|nr:hypothetical protein BCR34DRAFT_562883 [Clohesyomyces aquaticus]